MSLCRALNKPYYFYRPRQLVRRFGRVTRVRGELQTARLPWGHAITVRPDEAIGASIIRTGVFELPVTETIRRLLDAGELAVDAGANIGYMTSLMAASVGPGGKVVSVEPHPELFAHLRRHACEWGSTHDAGEIQLAQAALSDRVGRAMLHMGPDFECNTGTATLRPAEGSSRAIEVSVTRLDRLLDEQVALLKLDVEGHELRALAGAEGLLSGGRIRDILFEQLEPLPTPASEHLEARGYRLFALEQRFTGVRLASPASASRALWHAPTYLATIDPGRATARMRRRGWTALRSRARRST